MEQTSRYVFGNDGALWTLYNGGRRRPSTVEEMEGYCRERQVFSTGFPIEKQPELEKVSLAIAV